MNASIWSAGLIVIILWIFALWKAVEWWSPRFRIAEPAPKETAPSGSIFPKLFWACHVLVLVAALLQTVNLGETTKAEPEMIRLATQHKLASDAGYKDILYWVRAFWFFEKPVQISCAIFLLVIGLVVTGIYDGSQALWLFGFNLFFFLWLFCKYTIFVIKKDFVTIYRWLDAFPLTQITNTNIVSVKTDQSLMHQLFGVVRLTVSDANDNKASITLKDPQRAKACLEKIA